LTSAAENARGLLRHLEPRPRQLAALLALGAALQLSNPYFTFFDDEIAILQAALNPVKDTLLAYTQGGGQHRHPPLYDLLLAAWMRLTGGALLWLRLPAILAFLAGLWALARAAERLAGPRAAAAVICLGALWPYGFHFGRVAGWYSFAFLGVACVTAAYVALLESPSRPRWLALFAACLLLLYSSYFGWAILGLLAVDAWIRFRGRSWRPLAAIGATLVALALAWWPMWHAFLALMYNDREILRPGFSPLATLLFSGFNIYTLLVSESAAPWVWWLSVPAALAGVAATGAALRGSSADGRLLLAGFAVLFAAMSLLNLLTTKRLLLPAPWLLLFFALAFAAARRPKFLAASLAVIAICGWIGIFRRDAYSATRLVEPWPRVAREAATQARRGNVVIGNNPAFFFYLTMFLEDAGGRGAFRGTLPELRTHPGVFLAGQWLAAGKRVAPVVEVALGASDPSQWGPMEEATRWLEANCRLRGEQRLLPDSGARLKKKLFPQVAQPEWRIVTRSYDCAELARRAAPPLQSENDQRR
jgi:hypothetical protein